MALESKNLSTLSSTSTRHLVVVVEANSHQPCPYGEIICCNSPERSGQDAHIGNVIRRAEYEGLITVKRRQYLRIATAAKFKGGNSNEQREDWFFAKPYEPLRSGLLNDSQNHT